MKGAGFCSLNREVHQIVWSLNQVLGVPIFSYSQMSQDMIVCGCHPLNQEVNQN